MIGTDSFANTFPSGGLRGAFPTKKEPVPVAPAPTQYDPEVEKMRKLMLKVLTYLVGGAAVIAIVISVILKFV